MAYYLKYKIVTTEVVAIEREPMIIRNYNKHICTKILFGYI